MSQRAPLTRPALLAVVASLSALACTSTDADPHGAGGASHAGPTALAPLVDAPLATARALELVHAVDVSAAQNPAIPDVLAAMRASGFGALREAAGLEVVPVTLDGAPAPQPGPGAKLLARFVHLSDIQLADDESPARLAAIDVPGLIAGAYRPHEAHECRILHAAVRTVNALHHATPVSFVLLGGDNADNAQDNEVGWVQAILGGAPSVECDSGADDDPVPGPDNDPKDPFVAEGLAMPWRWVTGNHDVLVQGTAPIADENSAIAIGSYSANGARDWSQPGGPVARGYVIADGRRALLGRAALMKKIRGDGDGHGLDDAAVKSGKATYAFDVPGSPLRIVVVDSAAETGGSEGVIHQADVDARIRPLLDAAKAEGKLVIVASHHSTQTLTDGGTIGGTPQADAVTVEAWRALLGGYDNVLVHLAGHTHRHRHFTIEPPGGHAYFELETASLADYPHQMRVIELWDQDDGHVSLRAIPLDYSIDGDPVAAEGREISVVDLTSGWGQDGRGDPKQRAVELWMPKPAK